MKHVSVSLGFLHAKYMSLPLGGEEGLNCNGCINNYVPLGDMQSVCWFTSKLREYITEYLNIIINGQFAVYNYNFPLFSSFQ